MPASDPALHTPAFVAAPAERPRARRAEIAARLDAGLHGQGEDRRDTAGLPRRADETDDDGAAESARASDLNAIARLAHEIDELDAALGRVAAGTYGECIDCGDPIAAARLTAYPAALRCADCQQFNEHHAGRTARPGG